LCQWPSMMQLGEFSFRSISHSANKDIYHNTCNCHTRHSSGTQIGHHWWGSDLLDHRVQECEVTQDKHLETIEARAPTNREGVKVPHHTVQNNVTNLVDNHHQSFLSRWTQFANERNWKWWAPFCSSVVNWADNWLRRGLILNIWDPKRLKVWFWFAIGGANILVRGTITFTIVVVSVRLLSVTVFDYENNVIHN